MFLFITQIFATPEQALAARDEIVAKLTGDITKVNNEIARYQDYLKGLDKNRGWERDRTIRVIESFNLSNFNSRKLIELLGKQSLEDEGSLQKGLEEAGGIWFGGGVEQHCQYRIIYKGYLERIIAAFKS